jgi:dihydrofolate synthase/folylpolyglutamate synthase
LALLGEHQAANAAVAVACVEELRNQGMAIADEAVRAGLKQVQWAARMEVVGRRPLVVLDCAHNVASVQALLDTLQTSFPPARRALIFAVSRDKDLAGMAALLAPYFERTFLTTYTSSRRAVGVDELAGLWKRHGGIYEVCATPREAWRLAQEWATPEDLICISGSVFLAGELRPVVLHLKT